MQKKQIITPHNARKIMSEFLEQVIGAEPKLESIKQSNSSFQKKQNNFSPSQYEHLVILYLDQQKNLLIKKIIFSEEKQRIKFNIDEIFGPALKVGAKFLILGHNHPSGNQKLSQRDKLTLQKLQSAGRMLGIKILDLLVI